VNVKVIAKQITNQTPTLPVDYRLLFNEETITSEQQAYYFASAVKALAIDFGFDSYRASLVALATSEIAVNACRYANGAEAFVYQTENSKGLHVQINDTGPGIDNIDQAMRSGFSSQHSLGLGLSAAQRSVDEMYIDTSTVGTQVSLVTYLPVSEESLNIGYVSFGNVHEAINRDGYFVKAYHGECVFLAIFDCAEKHDQVTKVKELLNHFFSENYLQPLPLLIRECHQLLQANHFTQGVDIGLLKICPDKIRSIVLGNIRIVNVLDPAVIMSTLPGKLGLNLPEKILVTEQIITPELSLKPYCFALHTNGIKAINLPEYDISDLNAQQHADKIFDNHAIVNDDSTIIVVKLYG